MSFLLTLYLNLDANQVAQKWMTRIIQNCMIDYDIQKWMTTIIQIWMNAYVIQFWMTGIIQN